MSYIAEGDGPDFKPGEDVQHIPPTVVVFHGHPTVFFLAVCEDCAGGGRLTPQPFATEDARTTWVRGHSEVHRNIKLAVEVRP